MNKQDIRKKYNKQKKLLLKYNHHYFNLDSPLISDSKYDYLKNERVMSKNERKNKIDEINKVEKEFREKQQKLQQELQSKQNSELNRIRVIVENAINDYAKDNDYDLILRADGTTLYAKTYVDITQEIIEKLN